MRTTLTIDDTLRAGLETPVAAARPRYVCPTFYLTPAEPHIPVMQYPAST